MNQSDFCSGTLKVDQSDFTPSGQFLNWIKVAFLNRLKWIKISTPCFIFQGSSPNLVSNVMSNTGGATLDCIIWSLVDTHLSTTFGFGSNHIRMQHLL